jgi:hypothetical protein
VGEVIANMSMSLDGFVEDATGSALPLFGWIERLMQPGGPHGDAERASSELFQEATAGVGAVVCGRRLVDLVPVLLGAGRPFFAALQQPPVRLGTPRVVQGAGVTHLRYRIERAEP